MTASHSSSGSAPTTLAQAFGLLTEGKAPVPLLGVHVEAEIRDLAVRQTITQHYRNTEATPIEAVYVFPIDETAAICGFNAVINGQLIVGQAVEREAAFEAYDDALRDGHGAYLLDQERPDVFTASIGNLPPGAEVLIQVITASLLGSEGEDMAYVLPTTVAPRFAPEVDRKGVGRPPAEALNPPLDWQVPYGLELHIQLDMPFAIRRLESPTHPLRFEVDGKRGEVFLGEQAGKLDHDLVIYIGLAERLQSRVTIERHPSGKYALMAVFHPDQARRGREPAPAKEIVFLLDRSASMQGPSIESAKQALQLFLRSLPEGCAFNVVGFGDTFDPLFPESRRYDQGSLENASQIIDSIRTHLGGTEILSALQFVLQQPRMPAMEREIIVLTDGEVTNTEAVLDLVHAFSSTTRLSSIGLGASASRHLVNGLARAGNGWAEYIAPGERPQAKVIRQLQRALAPQLPPLKIDWGGMEVEQAPWELRAIGLGERMIVFGLTDEVRPVDVSLADTAWGGARAASLATLAVNPADAGEGIGITTLAARELVRDLEEGSSRLHSPGGSRQTDRRGPVVQRARQRLVELGTTYGLLTSATSFVAVEVRETPVRGEIELRRIPVALARDWGGLAEGHGGQRYSMFSAIAGPDEPDAKIAYREAGPNYYMDGLYAIMSVQHADGCWSLDPAHLEMIDEYVSCPVQDSHTSLMAVLPGDTEPHRRTVSTAIMIGLLELEFESRRAEWGLMAEKARTWLRDHGVPHPDGADWVEMARQFLSTTG